MEPDGTIKKQRLVDSFKSPQNIISIIMIVVYLVSGVTYIYGLSNRIFSSKEQAEDVLDVVKDAKVHMANKDVHQPYKEKREEWYTREEALKLDERVKRLETLDSKMSVLIQLLREEKKK